MGYKVNQETVTKCLECGEAIVWGRSDRKFCCNECKNRFNNRKSRKAKVVRLKVRNAIEKNYAILEKLIKLKIDTIDIPDIVMMGYKIDFFTSHHKVRGHNEYWCYDIKYFMSESRLFSIQKSKIFITEMAPKTAKESLA